MHLGLVLDMVASGFEDRPAISADGQTMSYVELAERSRAARLRFQEQSVPSVVYVGANHLAYPVALFGAAGAGIPFVPLNYRLGPEQLAAQLEAQRGALVIHDSDVPPFADRALWVDQRVFVGSLAGLTVEQSPDQDPDTACVLLYTSGTTSTPKAAVLRQRHIVSYLFGTCEFGSAGPEEVSLVSVPPYHIAGVANLLSNLYAGRRIAYLDRFDPGSWLQRVRQEQVTQAMVVPTMLARIVAHLQGADDAATPSLATLSYGGSHMPPTVLRRALELFPTTGFVNAYGLTETSSTIALLGPEDHRAALTSDDPQVRARLTSVGQPLPGIELEVRDEDGHVLPSGTTGLLYLRGDQISGEYVGGSRLEGDGWFSTRDRAWIDGDGYVFIEGRADDTIIRGGENIAPAEIEDVLMSGKGVLDAVVVGLPDDEWGQRIVGVVVAGAGQRVDAEGLRDLVRLRLRSSKTPERIEIWDELPRTDTGKLVRRVVIAKLLGDREATVTA
jgi:acyl-CoA synthetase (AMP-forming)/AMP-acid ligase II